MSNNIAQKAPPKQKSSPLSGKAVKEIRALHARAGGGWTSKSLARIFDTSEVAITAVMDRTGSYKD